MNTASRMESTGARGKVQLSQECANLLIAAGKSSWLIQREGFVVAKGKGQLRTYWLKVGSESSIGSDPIQTESHDVTESPVEISPVSCKVMESTKQIESHASSEIEGSAGHSDGPLDPETERLIKQGITKLLGLLKEILSHDRPEPEIDVNADLPSRGMIILDEILEKIDQPIVGKPISDSKDVLLDVIVIQELEAYLTAVASMYPSCNPFHNFEHACYVAENLDKLFSLLPRDYFHPLTRFTAILAAYVHDIDHCGVPNDVLAVEKPSMKNVYQGQSIAEQNSFNLAWDLLQDNNYTHLRQAIYQTRDEKRLFRQVLVQCILATDLLNKEYRHGRDKRWEACFRDSSIAARLATKENESLDFKNRYETCLLEHMMQLATLAHMAEEWTIYLKWTSRMYLELRKAFADGRLWRDPGDAWVNGELGCFDFFILPLTKRLRECGQFGTFGDQAIVQLEQNRAEWQEKGRDIIRELAQNARKQAGV